MKRFAQLFVEFRQFDKCIASLRRFFPVLDRQRNILDLYKNIKLNGKILFKSFRKKKLTFKSDRHLVSSTLVMT
jgi:hypothetical protein